MLIQRNDIFEGNLVYFEKTIDKTNISWKYVSCQTFRNFVQFSAFACPPIGYIFLFFLSLFPVDPRANDSARKDD